MPPRKREPQQLPSAGGSSKRPKETHPSAAANDKGKARAASASPGVDIHYVAITDLGTLSQTVKHFSLHHRDTHPPIGVVQEDRFAWPITGEMVDGWLFEKLGLHILREIDLAVEKGSVLHQFMFKYRSVAPGERYDGGRQVVDQILLAATSIANGSGAVYRNERTWEYPSEMGLKKLRLMFEVPVVFDDEVMGRQYTGRMDWALGTVEKVVLREGGDSNDISTEVGNRMLLAVVEEKGPETHSVAKAQLLAYMGCLYRNREARGTREDSSAFGITTDGTACKFYMLDQQEASGGPDNQRAHVPVRESRHYELRSLTGLRVVLGMIIYILQRGAALITPHGVPVEGDDDGAIVDRR